MKHYLSLILSLAVATAAIAQDFKFEAGYPEPEMSRALYDEIDY